MQGTGAQVCSLGSKQDMNPAFLHSESCSFFSEFIWIILLEVFKHKWISEWIMSVKKYKWISEWIMM